MTALPHRQDIFHAKLDHWTERLASDGYAIIPDLVDPEVIAAIDEDFSEPFSQTPFSKGGFFGSRTVRFGRALVRSRHAASLVQHELILGLADRVLGPWCDSIQLNLTQGIAVHPGAQAQIPHRDQDMWRGVKGEVEYMVNVIWPFTRFTEENGATLVWSGSHKADDQEIVSDAVREAAEMEPGSALVFLGSTLHGQGANRSSEIRRGFAVAYSLSWLKAYENQFLAYPPEIARGFSPELAALIGYRQLPHNLNNFEAQSPAVLLQDKVPDHFGAIDLFRPEQVAAIEHYLQAGKPRTV
jgi:ectoine hydroxylase-related dioxygenase (phytanoyl-CoA dioxygenase family)